MKRSVFILLALAVGATTTGCGTLKSMWQGVARTSAVAFTGAQADEMPLRGIKLGGCENVPLPEGFPAASAGCLMPIKVLARGEKLTTPEVAALAQTPLNLEGGEVEWIYCPPSAVTDRGTSGPTSDQCRAVPNFAVVDASVRPMTGGNVWSASRLSYEEK